MPTHQFRSWRVDTCRPVLDAAFHLNGNRSGLSLVALEHVTCPPVLEAAFHLNGNRSGLLLVALEHVTCLSIKKCSFRFLIHGLLRNYFWALQFAILGLKPIPMSNTNHRGSPSSSISAYLNRQWRPVWFCEMTLRYESLKSSSIRVVSFRLRFFPSEPVTGCINSLQLTTFVTPSTYSKDDSSFSASFLYR